jgi:hypothetical protein
MLQTDLVTIFFSIAANLLSTIGQIIFQVISSAVLQFIFDTFFGSGA